MRTRSGSTKAALVLLAAAAAAVLVFSVILAGSSEKPSSTPYGGDCSLTESSKAYSGEGDIAKTEAVTLPPQKQRAYEKTKTIKNICQLPELPTGCEVTALAVLLQSLGYDADPVALARHYLPMQEFYISDGLRFGADPDKAFAGSPFTADSYGAYSGAIEATANAYLTDKGSPLRARAYQSCDFELFSDMVKAGKPVLIWVTIDLKESTVSDSWFTLEGEQVCWRSNEHCMVLVTIDEQNGTVLCADPLKNTEELCEYELSLFTEGAQGLIIA